MATTLSTPTASCTKRSYQSLTRTTFLLLQAAFALSACEPLSDIVLSPRGGAGSDGMGGAGSFAGGEGTGGAGSIAGRDSMGGAGARAGSDGMGGAGALGGAWLDVKAGAEEPADVGTGCFLATQSPCRDANCTLKLDSVIACDGAIFSASVAQARDGHSYLAVNSSAARAPVYLFDLAAPGQSRKWAQPCGAGETYVVPGGSEVTLIAHQVPGHGTVRCAPRACPDCGQGERAFGARIAASLPTDQRIADARLDVDDRLIIVADDGAGNLTAIAEDHSGIATQESLLGEMASLSSGAARPAPFFFSGGVDGFTLRAHLPQGNKPLHHDGTVRAGTKASAVLWGGEALPWAVFDVGTEADKRIAYAQPGFSGTTKFELPGTAPDPRRCMKNVGQQGVCAEPCSELIPSAGFPGLHALVTVGDRMVLAYLWAKIERSVTFRQSGAPPHCEVDMVDENIETYLSFHTVRPEGSLGPALMVEVPLGAAVPSAMDADAHGSLLAVALLTEHKRQQLVRHLLIDASKVAP